MTITPLSRRILSATIGLVSIFGIGIYLWLERDEFANLIRVPWQQVMAVAGLIALGHWLNALEFWLLYRRLGAPITMGENWLLFTAGQLLNHVPGQMGTLYRFRYLKSVYGMSYGRTASGYTANLVITVIAASVLGLGGSLAAGALGRPGAAVMMAMFGALLVGSVGALVIRLPTSSRTGRMAEAWGRFHSGWSKITDAPRMASSVAALEVGKYALGAVRLKLAFSWIGIEASMPFFLVIASVIGIVSFLAFTPAGLGLREFAIATTAAVLGSALDQSLFGATIERAVLLVVSIVLGGFGLLYTGRRLPELKRAKDPS